MAYRMKASQETRARGFVLVLLGLFALVGIFALENMQLGLDPQGAIVAMVALFVFTLIMLIVGTALIVVDKKHSTGLAVLLGIISPLGTLIAFLLPNKAGQAWSQASSSEST